MENSLYHGEIGQEDDVQYSPVAHRDISETVEIVARRFIDDQSREEEEGDGIQSMTDADDDRRAESTHIQREYSHRRHIHVDDGTQCDENFIIQSNEEIDVRNEGAGRISRQHSSISEEEEEIMRFNFRVEMGEDGGDGEEIPQFEHVVDQQQVEGGIQRDDQ